MGREALGRLGCEERASVAIASEMCRPKNAAPRPVLSKASPIWQLHTFVSVTFPYPFSFN